MDPIPLRQPLHSYSISRGTLAGELVKLILCSFIAIIISLILDVLFTGLMIVTLGIKQDSTLKIVGPSLGILGFLVFLALSWQVMKRFFHFRLDIHADRLQSSAFWLRDSLELYEVEGIRLVRQQVYGITSEHIEISGNGKKWPFYLYEKNADCLQNLLAACPNAVYTDAEGCDHPPEQPADPEKVRQYRIRKCRREGIVYLTAGMLGTGLLISMALWPFFHGGIKNPDSVPLFLVVARFLFFAFLGIGAIAKGIGRIREARRLASPETNPRPT